MHKNAALHLSADGLTVSHGAASPADQYIQETNRNCYISGGGTEWQKATQLSPLDYM